MKTHNNHDHHDHDQSTNKFVKVICWQCKTIVLANPLWGKVQCPLCKEISLIAIPDTNFKEKERVFLPNIDIDTRVKRINEFATVVCNKCKRMIKTKRESDYVVCSKCKNCNITNKGINVPDGVDPANYIKHRFGTFFNPYKRNPSDPFYLKEGFEFNVVEDAREQVEKKRMEKFREGYNNKVSSASASASGDQIVYQSSSKYQVYKPLIETINEINENIKNSNKYTNENTNYFSPQPRRTKILDIAESGFFKNIKSDDYTSKYISMNKNSKIFNYY
jgi:hypothetical protein